MVTVVAVLVFVALTLAHRGYLEPAPRAAPAPRPRRYPEASWGGL